MPVRLVLASAELLPFPDSVFETVVATCVFCTVPDPERGFHEIRRVLKPEGNLRLLEHVRASSLWAARLQDRLTPAWSRVVGGCHLNRATLDTARRAGFRVDEMETRFGGVIVRARLSAA